MGVEAEGRRRREEEGRTSPPGTHAREDVEACCLLSLFILFILFIIIIIIIIIISFV